MEASEVLSRLSGVKAEREGQWMAKCPAHDDGKASLSVGDTGGKLLFHCQAGCETGDVVAAIGLKVGDLFTETEPKSSSKIVKTYDYRDENGELLYQVVRFEPKDFRQRQPDGAGGWKWSIKGVRPVLYRLPELLDAPPDATVFVVEGEKDADALARLGLCATTNAGGSSKWRQDYAGALQGRDVVVLPDNDAAGMKHALAVVSAVSGARVANLPGLPSKGDVSDWLGKGNKASDLLALTRAPKAFERSPDRLEGERAERIEIGKQALTFGVQYLDDAMGGILSRDIVLIGAKTGMGKTALATSIAMANAKAGKRVHYFALEAEDREIERRMKFQIIADQYYKDGFARPPIRYVDWYMGKLEHELGQYEDVADMEMRRIARNLHTFYRIDSFTSEDFARHLKSIEGNTDLVVLDHLHYVDNTDDNENRGYKTIVKQVRDAAIKSGKPVVLVAHVRKSDKRNDGPIPDIEDFHGSSDIAKVATKAVMMAPAKDQDGGSPYVWPTYFQIAKCRLESAVTRLAAVVLWDTRLNAYDPGYALGRIVDKGFVDLEINERPPWAKRKERT